MIAQSRGFARSRDKLLYISTCTKPMRTEYRKFVTYHEGFPTINLHKPVNM